MQCCDNAGNASLDVVCRAGSWHANMCGKPCDGVTDACSPGFVYLNGVALIGVPGRGNVPTLHAMWCPASTCIRLDMGQHTCAWQGDGHAIKVKESVDIGPRRQFWVALAAAEQIEGEFCLW